MVGNKASSKGSEYYTISMNSYFIKYVTYQATEVKTLDKAVHKWFHTRYVDWNISLSLCTFLRVSKITYLAMIQIKIRKDNSVVACY